MCMTIMGEPHRKTVSEKMWKGNERETTAISMKSRLGRGNGVSKGLT